MEAGPTLFRCLVGLLLATLVGCNWGANSRVPPPGTNGYNVPNNYYQQPPAGSPFTAPGYGSGSAAPTGSTAPGLGQAAKPNVSLDASGVGDHLSWQPVTKQPSIGGGSTIRPNTTLTTIRTPSAPTAGVSPVTASPTGSQRVEITQLPGRPGNSAALPANTPQTQPVYPPVNNVRSASSADPWRGR